MSWKILFKLVVRDKVKVVLGQVKEVTISKRKVGIYVFTNQLTGEQYVVRSINLGQRISNYLSSTAIATRTRLVFANIREHSLSTFTLHLYIIKEGYTENARG